jgi:hypothetical protein
LVILKFRFSAEVEYEQGMLLQTYIDSGSDWSLFFQ